MELAHRTTILLPHALHERLARLAERRGVSMGSLVREAIEAQYGRDSREERLAAVSELRSLSLPVGSVAEMKAESIDEGEPVP